jgi:hypothetical protein
MSAEDKVCKQDSLPFPPTPADFDKKENPGPAFRDCAVVRIGWRTWPSL